MRIFEIVKENVNLREAAELYGIDVNRYGKALCPFHNDRNPSLYVADDHYYCFACGEHGDVIDFAGRLFQLSLYDAARKLMADFHLSPDKPPSAAALHAKRIRTEAQQLMENERLCFSVLSDYARVLRDWKVRYAPQSPDAPVHARFVEACHKLDEMEYYLDILCAGDAHERAEVVQQQMADGRLDRLRRRLVKIPVNRGLGGGRFFCQPPPPQNGRIGKPCGTPWRKPKPQRTAASPVNLWRRCP